MPIFFWSEGLLFQVVFLHSIFNAPASVNSFPSRLFHFHSFFCFHYHELVSFWSHHLFLPLFSFTSSLICFQIFQVFELSGGFTDCHSAFLLFDLAGSVSLHSRFSRKSEPLSAPFFQAECLPLSFESLVVIIGLVPHS